MNYYSNIYWHFTGSPKDLEWQSIFCPDDIVKYNSPKTDDESIEIVENIFNSQTLFAKACEKINNELKTSPFCCVTDIPLQNLHEHRKYYGNVAIGFKHMQIQQQFNPVLYVPKNLIPTDVINSASDLERKWNIVKLLGLAFTPFISEDDFNKKLRNNSKTLTQYIINHIKVTEFSDLSSRTFYREREWRKIGDFKFSTSDIAALIVSKKSFEKANKILSDLKIKNVPILTWELIENM